MLPPSPASRSSIIPASRTCAALRFSGAPTSLGRGVGTRWDEVCRYRTVGGVNTFTRWYSLRSQR
eukprot:1590968-Prymnesium_polylepis.3